MYYSAREIVRHENFPSAVLGDKPFIECVAIALALIPSKIVTELLQDCLYCPFNSDLAGAYVCNEILAGRDLIFIVYDSFSEDEDADTYIFNILHETAHYVLGHKPLKEGFLYKGQHRLREEETNKLVLSWFKQFAEYNAEFSEYFPNIEETLQRTGIRQKAPKQDMHTIGFSSDGATEAKLEVRVKFPAKVESKVRYMEYFDKVIDLLRKDMEQKLA